MGKIIQFPNTKANIYIDNLDTEEKIETKDISMNQFIDRLENLFDGIDDDTDVIVFTIKTRK